MKTLLVAVFAVAIVVSGARGAVYETVVPITTSDMLKEVPVAWTAVSESNGLRLRYEAKSIEPTRMFDAVDLYIFSYPLEGRDLSKAVHDLIQVQQELGFNYQLPQHPAEHYQWICPPCRRASLALAQGQRWQTQRRGPSPHPAGQPYHPSTPTAANPGLGEGPLGTEDAHNFHP